MNLRFSTEDEAFRGEVRAWLETHLAGPFSKLRGRGGTGDMDALVDERRVWEHELAAGGWTCLSWPVEHGGRGATLHQEVIFHEEYARARAPGRLGHIGETLLGPTMLDFGTPEQKARFLPPIAAAQELWCQGYSEPNAGSDLANLRCRAELDGETWVITGQKVWTSLAEFSDWCFALCRTEGGSERHAGISCLLIPMNQPGMDLRPIQQITGSSEFCEVFFDGARTARENVVGPVGGGWKVAMATLGYERGVSTLGQQVGFTGEWEAVVAAARRRGTLSDPLIRDRLADLWMRLQVMRHNALRMLSAGHTAEGSRANAIVKLYWATWHLELGEVAMDALGDGGGDPELERLFLWSRCSTIYAGTNEIQRNIIARRALGLPRGR